MSTFSAPAPLTRDSSLPVRRRATPPPAVRCAPGSCRTARTGPPSIVGVERAVARASVSPSLTLTTAPPRSTLDAHLIAIARRRRVRIELVLVVRRAERSVATGATTALAGRHPVSGR